MTLPTTIDVPAEPPADAERRLFTRPVQVAFLEALATSGAVRSAAASAGVSYRTAYRERRSSPAFRRAWDAALLSARAMSEDVLACRAIEGVEEEVWYHGEVVATRRRYDARLLLAHLARLDKLTEDARTRAFADDYEGALERFAAGIDDPAPVCGVCGEALPVGVDEATGDFAPGQCDTCDTPPVAVTAPAPAPTPRARKARKIKKTGPCPECGGDCPATQPDGGCKWLSELVTRYCEARPRGAREPHEFPGYDVEAIDAAQLAAFEQGIERWWLVRPPEPGEDGGPVRWFEDEPPMEFKSAETQLLPGTGRWQRAALTEGALRTARGWLRTPPPSVTHAACHLSVPGRIEDAAAAEPIPPPPVSTFQPARFRTLEVPPHETASPRREPGVVWW